MTAAETLDQEIARQRRHVAAMRARRELQEAQERRNLERMTATNHEVTYRACQQLAAGHRWSQGRYGRPMSVTVASRELRRLREDDPRYVEPDAARYRQHIESLCRRHGITASFIETPGAYTNGYAWRSRSRAEGPVIRTAWTYATWLHEVAGHCLAATTDCQRLRHVRVKTEGLRSVCVECEIESWRAAQRVALHWNHDMHENMARGLASYAPYATPAEREEINAMTSRMGYCRIRQARVTGDFNAN